MKDNVKVSVIIPVYNAEKFLKQCLDSILNQTLKDIEVICVNDGSSDNSLDILNEYRNNDDRMIIIDQENHGAGYARNAGLEIAKGKYVLFLDADDFFDQDMLSETYIAAENNNADIVLFSLDLYDDTNGEVNPVTWGLRSKYFLKSVCSAKDLGENIFKVTAPNPFTKLFRKNYVLGNGFQFQETRNTNDFFFVMANLVLADRITFVDRAFVHYRCNNAESTQGKKKKYPREFYKALCSFHDVIIDASLWENHVFNKAFCDYIKAQINFNLKEISLEKISKAERDYYSIKLCRGQKIGDAQLEPVREFVQEKKSGNIAPKVSVIIPAYNAELYLRDCLDSIVNQTCSDIEIICINDGSIDDSLKILEEYYAKDDRITLISKENGGLSSARNRGMQYANGDYILFLDSDDMLKNNAVEYMYQYSAEKGLDVLFFEAEALYETEEMRSKFSVYDTYYHRKNVITDDMSGTELFSKLVSNKEYRPSACLQFIRRKHLEDNGIIFLDGILHEDNLFTFKNLLQASRAGVINEAFYVRRVHEDSIMTRKQGFRNMYGYLACFAGMLTFVTERSFGDEAQAAIKIILDGARKQVCSIYGKLDDTEKQLLKALSPVEEMWLNVASGCETAEVAHLQEAIKAKDKKLKKLGNENNALKNSLSFKIGRAITFVPRKILDGIRYFKNH